MWNLEMDMGTGIRHGIMHARYSIQQLQEALHPKMSFEIY